MKLVERIVTHKGEPEVNNTNKSNNTATDTCITQTGIDYNKLYAICEEI